MSDRLSAADVAFFYLEGPTTPQHVGGLAVFTAPAAGSTTTGWCGCSRSASRSRRATGRRCDRAAQPGQPGVGRRRRLRHHLSRAALGAAASGHRARAARVLRADPVAAARPRPSAVGDVPRRRAVRRPRRDRHQDPPVDGRRRADGPRSTSPRCCSTSRPSRGARSRRCGCRSASRRALRLVADALCGAVRRPAALADAVRLSMREARSTASWLTSTVGRAGRWRGRCGHAHRAHDARLAAARQPRAAPADRDRAHRPRRLPAGARRARRHGQRRRAGRRHRRAAAAGCSARGETLGAGDDACARSCRSA